ncbi:LysR family transcriptional regulator [Nonomuraea ferruginea]|uniref:LysR family transcriptional regulator n=1 Tax=Nonomuraea ferruginea TaxID=46174 RepID=A0ABT4T5Y1_9ACTN|nr:LysR family transcriptional regulator [Nonomuraea ferruginea]MDA0644568.1 LysR family transcriptional regulator [Nonomuraea ferruginea]
MAREIQCFARVAARLSFSRAAADLGMSQPAVSQAVARLERATGVRLFERSARTVRLTAAGAALLPYAEQVLESAAAFTAEASRLARPVIHLAYPPLAGPLAARIARRMAGRTPPVAVELHAAGRAAAAAALDAGEVSAAILATPAPARFTTAARFHVTVDHLAVPPTHPLAARAPEPHLTRPSRTPRTTTPDTPRPAEALRKEPGATEPRPAESGRGEVRPADLAGLVVLTPGGRRWAGLPGHPRMVRDDDFGAALDLVAAGAGVLPIPHLLVRSVRRDDVVFVPLEGADLQITYALAWSRERVTNELLALVQAMQDALWTR